MAAKKKIAKRIFKRKPSKKKAPPKNWKEHNRSTWDSDKRDELLELIKRDITQKDACAYVKLPVSTLHDWLKRDKILSEEYEHAEGFMHILTSNAISSWLTNKKTSALDKAKLWIKRKTLRDKRYSEKQEFTGEWWKDLFNDLTIQVIKNAPKND